MLVEPATGVISQLGYVVDLELKSEAFGKKKYNGNDHKRHWSYALRYETFAFNGCSVAWKTAPLSCIIQDLYVEIK